jgi:uncharacterized protein (TIRG00374 family)
MVKITKAQIIRYMLYAGALSIIAVLFVMQFATGLDFGSALKSLGRTNLWFILAAIAINVSAYFTEALQLYLLAKTLGKKPSFWGMMLIFFIGNFFSNVTPATSGGKPFQIYFLLDQGFSIAEGTVMVIARGIISVSTRIFLVLMVVVAVMLGFDSNLSGFMGWTFALTLIMMIALIAMGIAALLNPKFFSFLINIASRIKLVRKLIRVSTVDECIAKGYRFLDSVKNSSKMIFGGNKVYLALTIFTSLVSWFLLKAVPYFVLLSFGESVPLMIVVATSIISQLITIWVPTPGAAGGVEIGLGTLFKGLIANPGNLSPFVLVYRLIDYHLNMLVGLPIAFWALGKKVKPAICAPPQNENEVETSAGVPECEGETLK